MNAFFKKHKVICVTIITAAIFLVADVWDGLSAFPPFLLSVLISFVGILLFILFFANLGLVVFTRVNGASHFVMLVLIALCLVLFAWPNTFGNPQRRWFLSDGILGYDQMVDKVILNRSKLTNRSMPLESIVGRQNVYGMSNNDGSISIWFEGRGNLVRAGYLFYSGHDLVPKPELLDKYGFSGDSRYYVHITNNWYEY